MYTERSVKSTLQPKTSLGSISRIRSMDRPSGGTSPQMLLDLLDDVRFRNYSHHRVDMLAVF